ncbi:hypothetical protein AtNW77_Chr2g0225731 [Arabidopsis thaliana]
MRFYLSWLCLKSNVVYMGGFHGGFLQSRSCPQNLGNSTTVRLEFVGLPIVTN